MEHWRAKVTRTYAHIEKDSESEKGSLSFGISLNYGCNVVRGTRAWSVYEIAIFRNESLSQNGNGILFRFIGGTRSVTRYVPSHTYRRI